MAVVKRLGPFSGRYAPSYQLNFWKNGDPRQPVHHVDLRSVIAIQTSKSLDDVSGTFTITLKDRQARHYIQEMDTTQIKLRGHDDEGFVPVLKGVVDTVRAGGSADTYASRKDTVIEGRCMGKYLQITSMFLPVWDPTSLLPTALIFGLGDAAKKVGSNSPYDIWQYITKRFMFGQRNLAGVSGVPNSRFWVDSKSRFAKVDFIVPYLQFDEEDLGSAFKTLEIVGFTEAWMDELGRLVYRQPPWDAPISYRLPTSSLKDYDFPRTDIGTSTYFEVIPAGDPGIDSATAQALRAGRAPVPSSYLDAIDQAGDQASGGGQWHVSPEFVIDTDKKGKVTAKGAKNYWYMRQRRLGLRPQQITSSLIFTQKQAQAQAEGLLRFYGRMMKTMDVTIPGCPSVRLGRNVLAHGPLDAGSISRTFYIDAVQHEYVEGSHYDTTIHGSHGRDPWDPQFGRIVLPRFDPADLTQTGGVLSGGGGGGSTAIPGSVSPGDLKGMTPKDVIDKLILPVGRHFGLLTSSGAALTSSNVTKANASHGATNTGGRSDHQGPPNVAWAVDMSNGNDTPEEEKCAETLAGLFGFPYTSKGGLFTISFGGFTMQLIHRTMSGGNHYNHVHFGLHV